MKDGRVSGDLLEFDGTKLLTLLMPDLPEPSLPYLNQLRTAKVSQNLEHSPPHQAQSGSQANDATLSHSPGKSRRLRKDSLENLDSDPWASPATTKTQTVSVQNDATPASNAITTAKPVRSAEPARTTSTFTTHSNAPTADEGTANGGLGSNPEASGGWGSYGAAGAGQSGLTGGFGSAGDEPGNPSGGSLGRSIGGGRTVNRGGEEMVTVTLLPEKEGMFMFQHHNYEVKSVRRGSAVIRRYSDFVWLLDCLHKRYPFRQLPLLPPKRVAGTALHRSAHQFWADQTYSQRPSSLFRCFIHRKAPPRPRPLRQRSSPPPRALPREARCHVPHSPHRSYCFRTLTNPSFPEDS